LSRRTVEKLIDLEGAMKAEVTVHVLFTVLMVTVGGFIVARGSVVEAAALVFGVAWMMVYTQVMDRIRMGA
jgi:hypothetical protein